MSGWKVSTTQNRRAELNSYIDSFYQRLRRDPTGSNSQNYSVSNDNNILTGDLAAFQQTSIYRRHQLYRKREQLMQQASKLNTMKSQCQAVQDVSKRQNTLRPVRQHRTPYLGNTKYSNSSSSFRQTALTAKEKRDVSTPVYSREETFQLNKLVDQTIKVPKKSVTIINNSAEVQRKIFGGGGTSQRLFQTPNNVSIRLASAGKRKCGQDAVNVRDRFRHSSPFVCPRESVTSPISCSSRASSYSSGRSSLSNCHSRSMFAALLQQHIQCHLNGTQPPTSAPSSEVPRRKTETERPKQKEKEKPSRTSTRKNDSSVRSTSSHLSSSMTIRASSKKSDSSSTVGGNGGHISMSKPNPVVDTSGNTSTCEEMMKQLLTRLKRLQSDVSQIPPPDSSQAVTEPTITNEPSKNKIVYGSGPTEKRHSTQQQTTSNMSSARQQLPKFAVSSVKHAPKKNTKSTASPRPLSGASTPSSIPTNITLRKRVAPSLNKLSSTKQATSFQDTLLQRQSPSVRLVLEPLEPSSKTSESERSPCGDRGSSTCPTTSEEKERSRTARVGENMMDLSKSSASLIAYEILKLMQTDRNSVTPNGIKKRRRHRLLSNCVTPDELSSRSYSVLGAYHARSNSAVTFGSLHTPQPHSRLSFSSPLEKIQEGKALIFPLRKSQVVQVPATSSNNATGEVCAPAPRRRKRNVKIRLDTIVNTSP